MWIIAAPSSTARRASAAYSSGVYGIPGHWSRFATTPEIELVMMTGSSKLTGRSSYGHDAVPLPGSLDALALGHLKRAADRRTGVARVDHVVDQRASGRHVDVDQSLVGLDQLR